MFDRRSGRRARDVRGQSTVSQERLSRRRDARGSVVRARRSARARFFSWNVFSWNETRSRVFVLAFWRTRVSERHRLALDAGTHPSVLPVRLTRLTRHARLQHHRRALHEPLRANLRRAVAHGARSVRVYLPRSKNSRETTWARCWNVRLAASGSPDPRGRRDRTRARAHTAERDRLRGRSGLGEKGRSSRGSECPARRSSVMLQTHAWTRRSARDPLARKWNGSTPCFFCCFSHRLLVSKKQLNINY